MKAKPTTGKVQFSCTIQKFASKGEKTGWTYIKIPANIAAALQPGNKKSFRVKGKLDSCNINGIALLPMGEGDFIMALNSSLRKKIGKQKGAKLAVQLMVDEEKPALSADLMNCLDDEPQAKKAFTAIPKSYQNYYSKWIESAKTDATKAKRISMTVWSLARGMSYAEMLKSARMDKQAGWEGIKPIDPKNK
jgi:hypothetical protein